ncbi:MAG: hypothetical protein Q7S85_10870 [Rugosibacter sp.]|nr:hypothetical protein [Rugosibacter sp.]
MNDRGFGKRLAQELPRWQKEGWVSVEGGQVILADLAARQSKAGWASSPTRSTGCVSTVRQRWARRQGLQTSRYGMGSDPA